MMKLGIFCMLFAASYAAKADQCERDYEKKGCIPEAHQKMDLIVNHRMIIEWGDMHFSNRRLICECSKQARAQGYSYFEIRFWAECWAGKNLKKVEEVLAKGPRVTTCMDGDFKKCNDADEKECVGTDRSGYIYFVKPEVDGGLSAWSKYSKCSKPCAGGTKTRTRSCTNPAPKYGGKQCVGDLKETVACNEQPCPVDGGFSAWSTYSKCSKSCGSGVQVRARKCNNPEPKHGGKPCNGAATESKPCNTQKCPVNGGFSNWSGFGGCSRSCGGGTQSRHRACNSPSPAYGGAQCAGVTTQSRRCNTNPCVCNNFRFVECGQGVCNRFRFVARGQDCKSNVYTRIHGRCDGWPRMSFEECKRRCLRNDAPGGCPRRPCKYVIHDKNPGTPPGWCQLATDGCRLGRTNNGHVTYVRSC